jgi:toxin ParE1/3/4
MKVSFEPAARDDLDRIFDWIANQSPRAATELIARIEAKVMWLENRELTHMGRPGLVHCTRELLEWPYIIVYRVDEIRQEVVVVSVAHGAQHRDSEP